jgi:hypothetical protein
MAVTIETYVELSAWTALLRSLPLGETTLPPITFAQFDSLGTVAYRENKTQKERFYRLSGKNSKTNEVTISVSLKSKRRRK